MIELFPELPRAHAEPIADENSRRTIAALRETSNTTHQRCVFRETGGTRVEDRRLESIATDLRAIATEHGYPNRSGARFVAFDAAVGIQLHDRVGLRPTQGCREDVWSFFGCVLLPDVVRWRWGGDETPRDRFVGIDRGLRHTFGRAWWRAEMLKNDDRPEDPFHLLRELGEDEVVGFVERSGAITSRRTAVTMANIIIETYGDDTPVPRLTLARDVMKRFLRSGVVISTESQSDDELRALVRRLVEDSEAALTSST